MKSFRQFIREAFSIVEARETIASQQAKQMGLVGSGHGDWYDQQGTLVAKTVGGKLKVFKGRKSKGPENGQQPEQQKQQISQDQNISQEVSQGQTDQQEQLKGVAITIGRFNPPARNHEQLLKFGYVRAKDSNYEYRIYPSRVQNAGTNPLNPSLKIEFMQQLYPEYADYIVDSEEMKTIFDILTSLYNDGYQDVKIVVGSDRVGEFQSLVHRNSGQGYDFENIEVIPASVRDPDSDTGGSGSSAALRNSAANENYEEFSSHLPTRIKTSVKMKLFDSVVKSMKRGGQVGENFEMWKVIPELDIEGLRINYKKNNLYSVGSLIENINTGLVGEVLRRGTNYLICVTETGFMFKSWLTEVHEIGTDEYRTSVQKISAGQSVKSFSGISIKQTNPKKKLNINSKSNNK